MDTIAGMDADPCMRLKPYPDEAILTARKDLRVSPTQIPASVGIGGEAIN
jgi:hypothetical protein